MKNIIYTKTTVLLIAVMMTTIISCDRDPSDDVAFATFPQTAEIFTDTPIGLGSNFYFPYNGSKPTAWSVDNEVSYEGTASMRFDVPNANDPEGNYAGAIFRIDGDGSGRDLSGFDALTFWAKASQAVTIGEVGFGEDFGENRYLTTRNNISLTTNWQKYIVPIPDPSKLVRERGMLRYSAGGIGEVGSEVGYTFWMDEVKFEKLGTIAQPQPAIFNGVDEVLQAVVNSTTDISGLTQTFNTSTGNNLTVSVTPAYFDFTSSDTNIAIVNEAGSISLERDGSAKITATLAGIAAKGSIRLTASSIESAPTPTEAPSNVISLFSDTYTNITGSTIDANYGGQTTQSSEINISGDKIISYTNLNYVGFEFQNPTVDATDFNFLHIDVFTNSNTNNAFNIEIRDRGTNGEINTDVNTGAPNGDDKRTVLSVNANSITQGQWMSLEIPLTGDITAQKANLAAIIFSGDIDFLVDNIYFYK